MEENKTTENSINEKELNDDSVENKESTQEDKSESSTEEEQDPFRKLEIELAEMKDKYIRLYSEFENFRRRTSKEKMDLVKTAGEDIMIALLPVLDDFERALKAMGDDDSVKPLKEGVELIYNKTFKMLQAKGLIKMQSIGTEFNSDLHEAITQIPVTDEVQKGKVVDEVESGYYLGDKVIRFAKVVIGA